MSSGGIFGDDPEVYELIKDETLDQNAKELVEAINGNMTLI